MDDMILWADNTDSLKAFLAEVQYFLGSHLKLQLNPNHYINKSRQSIFWAVECLIRTLP